MKMRLPGAVAVLFLASSCAPESVPTTVADSSDGMSPAPYMTTLTDGRQAFVDQMSGQIGDRVFFAFDSSRLTRSAKSILDRQAAWLVTHPGVDIMIAGNADARGDEAYNLRLGQRRADAAAHYLFADGVSHDRLQTMSYGKDCPLAEGDNNYAYQQNRVSITSVDGYNPQHCR
jgi:peptidoglycan-associated lipoprotein